MVNKEDEIPIIQSVIINELLCFLSNKIDCMDHSSIVTICNNFYNDDEVEKAKDKLHEVIDDFPIALARKIDRKRKRQGPQKKLNHLKDLLCVLEQLGDRVPVFVAENLSRLPPVSFNSLDASSLLANISSIQDEISTIHKMVGMQNIAVDDLKNIAAQNRYDINSLKKSDSHKPIALANLSKSPKKNQNVKAKKPLSPEKVSDKELPCMNLPTSENSVILVATPDKSEKLFSPPINNPAHSPNISAHPEPTAPGEDLLANSFSGDDISPFSEEIVATLSQNIPNFNTPSAPAEELIDTSTAAASHYAVNSQSTDNGQSGPSQSQNITDIGNAKEPKQTHFSQSQGPTPPLNIKVPSQQSWANITKANRAPGNRSGSTTTTAAKKQPPGRNRTFTRGSNDDWGFKAIKQTYSIFTTRWPLDMDHEKIKEKLSRSLKTEVTCERMNLKSKYYASFKISAKCNNLKVLFNSNLWPDGLVIGKYLEPKKVNTSSDSESTSLGRENSL